MKDLDIYIKESLLDDIDDLEQVSDKNIDNHFAISNIYDITYVKVLGTNRIMPVIDKKAIKKLNPKYVHEFELLGPNGGKLQKSVSSYIGTLARSIMDINYDDPIQNITSFLSPIINRKFYIWLGNNEDGKFNPNAKWNAVRICFEASLDEILINLKRK